VASRVVENTVQTKNKLSYYKMDSKKTIKNIVKETGKRKPENWGGRGEEDM